MAFERRDFSGNAVQATLLGDITSTSTTIGIDNATGWPSGTNGKFLAVIDRGQANEEKLLVESRSGTTLQLASAADRGADGTTAAAHVAGAKVEHCTGALDADEANRTANNTLGKIVAKGDTLSGSGTGALVHTTVGTTGTVYQADSSQTGGVKWAVVNETNLASSVAGAGLAGGGGAPLSTNVDNATLEINADTLRVRDLGIVTAKINDLAVTTAKLAAASVDTTKLAVLPGCQAVRTSSQNVANNTYTPVQFNDTDAWDTAAFHDTVTSNTRIAIPATFPNSTRWKFTASPVMSAPVGATIGNREVRLLVNGATAVLLEIAAGHPSNSWARSVSKTLLLNPNDYVEMLVWQTSTETLTVTGTFTVVWESS